MKKTVFLVLGLIVLAALYLVIGRGDSFSAEEREFIAQMKAGIQNASAEELRESAQFVATLNPPIGGDLRNLSDAELLRLHKAITGDIAGAMHLLAAR